ncbi:hypothetical protein BDA96_02G299300 [Sorghum bicolor]|jgi:hypothetical protein|uniref:Uncharacterized protein n=2 Tax=Sorghum bicolor TaxID=4558 RepID=A0A921UU49_SORBI|nr:hypothetical protein BDA96_02G299300 [Sorghum bicolor]KXG36106.1 hypothetical protein SORBI_3002G284300 [Sorghum bicolor]
MSCSCQSTSENSRGKVVSLVAAATQVPYIIPGGESVSEALSFGTKISVVTQILSPDSLPFQRHDHVFPRVPATTAGKAEAADWQVHVITFMNDSAQSDTGLITGSFYHTVTSDIWILIRT